MTCITLDHDFHTHLALSLAESPSVVFVRVEGLNSQRQAELIDAVWEVCSEAIAAGAAISTDGVAVRIRRLPLK
jgi:predicted nuclease of predicted toxin-antitoxin system